MIYAAQYHGKEFVAKIAYSEKNHQRSLREEYKLLVILRHPCIIQLIGIFFTQDDSPALLMERMQMSLTEYLVKKRPFRDKVTILHDVTCGLCYIHSKNIIHCDLTGNNILLVNNTNARIADFGQAVTYNPNSNDKLPTNPGNVHHMPPEALQHQYSTKLDIFSFGCVIIHTVTQEFPIPDRYIKTPNVGSYKKLSEVDRRSVLIQKLKHYPDSAQLHKMVVECLQDDPDNRPTAAVLHVQLKKCMEEYSKINTHEQSKRQKSYKIKHKAYKLNRRSMKYVQDLSGVSVTESFASNTERHFAKVLTATGKYLSVP